MATVGMVVGCIVGVFVGIFRGTVKMLGMCWDDGGGDDRMVASMLG